MGNFPKENWNVCAPLSKCWFLDQRLLLSQPGALQALWKSEWKSDVPAWGQGLDQAVFERSLSPQPILYGSMYHIPEAINVENLEFQIWCKCRILLMFTWLCMKHRFPFSNLVYISQYNSHISQYSKSHQNHCAESFNLFISRDGYGVGKLLWI